MLIPDPNSPVENSEILFRSVRESEIEINNTGILRVKASAFNDRNMQPSVNRGIFNDNDPAKTQFDKSQYVVRLCAFKIRDQKIARADRTYILDIIPKPEKMNNTHAERIPSPEYKNKEAFRKVQESLSHIAQIALKPS